MQFVHSKIARIRELEISFSELDQIYSTSDS